MSGIEINYKRAVMHEVGTTRYYGFCWVCGWSGDVHEVSSYESHPHWTAIYDQEQHFSTKHRARYAVRRLRDTLRDALVNLHIIK